MFVALQMRGMLQGRSDSQQQQLLDVLAFHIIPQFCLRDAWALGQTCSTLWTLIQTGLPDKTYSSLARNTFPPHHPLLAVNDSDLRSAIRDLAAVHVSIRSGRIASSATLSLPEPNPPGMYDTLFMLSHRGDFLLSEQNHELRLHQLNVEGDELTMVLVWTMPALEPASSIFSCDICWSPDDSRAVISRKVHTSTIAGVAESFVVHSVEINTQAVVKLLHCARQHPRQHLPQTLFSPDGSHVLIQWDARFQDGCDFDVYSHWESKIVISARGGGAWKTLTLTPFIGFAFAPDSSRFAIASNEHHTGVCIHVIDVNSKTELWRVKMGVTYTAFRSARLAWSPDGSQIVYWLPGNQPHLCMFDAEHGEPQAIVKVETRGFCPLRGYGLLWGLYSPLPILWCGDAKYWERPKNDSKSCGILICCMPGNERPTEWGNNGHVLVQIGNCPPAISPDCMFLAALDPEGTSVCVHDARSGICVSRQEVNDIKRPCAVSLVWEPLARGLIVQIDHYSMQLNANLLLEQQTLTVLRF